MSDHAPLPNRLVTCLACGSIFEYTLDDVVEKPLTGNVRGTTLAIACPTFKSDSKLLLPGEI